MTVFLPATPQKAKMFFFASKKSLAKTQISHSSKKSNAFDRSYCAIEFKRGRGIGLVAHLLCIHFGLCGGRATFANVVPPQIEDKIDELTAMEIAAKQRREGIRREGPQEWRLRHSFADTVLGQASFPPFDTGRGVRVCVGGLGSGVLGLAVPETMGIGTTIWTLSV